MSVSVKIGGDKCVYFGCILSIRFEHDNDFILSIDGGLIRANAAGCGGAVAASVDSLGSSTLTTTRCFWCSLSIQLI